MGKNYKIILLKLKRKGYNLTDNSPLFIAYKGHFSKEEREVSS